MVPENRTHGYPTGHAIIMPNKPAEGTMPKNNCLDGVNAINSATKFLALDFGKNNAINHEFEKLVASTAAGEKR